MYLLQLLLILILVVLTFQSRRRSKEANERTLEIIRRVNKLEAEVQDLKEKSLIWLDEGGGPEQVAQEPQTTVDTLSDQSQEFIVPQAEYAAPQLAKTEASLLKSRIQRPRRALRPQTSL